MNPGAAPAVEDLLNTGLRRLKLAIPEGGVAKLLAYIRLLTKWNSAYNLTAIRSPENAVSYHILDSLSVVAHLPPGAIVDIGSGAGLPGIPIAIAEPARSVTLNDSSHKKIAFLRQVKIELALNNVDLYAGRVQGWRPEPRFDVAISRAFTQAAEFISLARHLLNPRGCAALMKGMHPQNELSGLSGDVRCQVVKLTVPLLDAERHLVLCEYTT